jgi:hypothetical protein
VPAGRWRPAAACAAALDAAGYARPLVLAMTDLLSSRRAADDHGIVFLVFRWLAVASAGRVKDPSFAASKWLNKGRPPVTAVGATGISSRHVGLEYALLHTRSMCHVAEAIHHPEQAILPDPTAV